MQPALFGPHGCWSHRVKSTVVGASTGAGDVVAVLVLNDEGDTGNVVVCRVADEDSGGVDDATQPEHDRRHCIATLGFT